MVWENLDFVIDQILCKWAATWQNQQNECGPAKTQISLGWSAPLLFAWRKLGSLATHWAHGEDSDQTGWMPRLIWVFAGRTLILLVLSCRGSMNLKLSLLLANWLYLSYDVTVIQRLMSCHKNCMTTHYITLGYWCVTSWCHPWQRYVYYWNNVNFKGDKIPF